MYLIILFSIRPPLYYDIEALISSPSLSENCSRTVGYLYENFPNYFNRISDVAKVFDNISQSDSFLKYSR